MSMHDYEPSDDLGGDLEDVARQVVACWESGDLAAAVRRMAEVLDAIDREDECELGGIVGDDEI